MKKHILIVSQLFYPEQFRINDMAAEWVKRGHRVTVVTGIPNYPQGKFYDGYSCFKKRKETWNGVEIIRIPLIARGNNSIGLVFNYFSFVISGFFWKCFTRIKADMVFTFGVSPMTQALLGVWYSKKRKVPHYLYVQDLWPENVEYVTGIHSRLVIGPISRMVNRIYKNCHKIFASSPSFVSEICKRCEGEEHKVVYWPQYAEDFYKPSQTKSDLIPQDAKLNVTFTGNIGTAQGLEILPECARILGERGFKVRFNIVGDGRNKRNLLACIREHGVEDLFNMIGWQEAVTIPSILAASDAAFLSFADVPIYSMTIPAKLQSYMACGIPILVAACGETQRIVEEADCGLVSELGSSEKLAELIVRFAGLSDDVKRKMGENGRRYCELHFNRAELHDEMLSEHLAAEQSTEKITRVNRVSHK